jgi:hypothetical protein
MPEPIFTKHGVYIMASQHISTAYFINPSQPSVSVCVPPRIIAGQQVGRHVPMATNTRNCRKVVGGVVFYTVRVRVVSKESL